MYIYCKKDFDKGLFEFKEGQKCKITNVGENCYYFCYPNGKCSTISSFYLKDNVEYLELRNERTCSHEKEIEILGLIICPECDELIRVL